MPMSNDEVVVVLNDLLETCYDGLDGFRTGISELRRGDVIEFCQSRIQRIDEAAAELYTAIRHLGGHPAEHGHPAARVHRGWIHLRGAVSAGTDAAIVSEIVRGEEQAVMRYDNALTQPLPDAMRDMVQDQANGARANLARARELKESK